MTQPKSNNLGQIAAIWISAYAPENQRLIWYDTNERIHKAYDTASGEWIAFNPQIVTNSTISQLRTIAQGSGLSVGKYYYLTDIGTLAIAITTTKVWYVDSHSNYVVNDLSASIQAYVNSDNLTIDGSTGVWNNSTGKLVFSFTRYLSGGSIQDSNDYIVMRRYNSSNSTWSWIKLRVKNIISTVSGNSITWDNGLYFSFASAINAIKNVAGGIVGYDTYTQNNENIAQSIQNVASGNQTILNTAKSYTDSKTTEAALLDKQIGRPRTIISNPPSVPGAGTTIDNIINILFSWIALLQNSNKIQIGSGFSPDGRTGNVNYSDNVRSAIEKLVYKVAKQAIADGISLPSGFNVNGRGGQFSASDTLNVLLEKSLYKIINLQNNKQNLITWKDEEGNEINNVVRFKGEFQFTPIVGEPNSYEAEIIRHDYINEDTWHAGNNMQWIIRNNILVLKMSRASYAFSVMTNRASVIAVGLGNDFNQYIQTVFNSIPWTYELTGSNFKQKFIRICAIGEGEYVDTSLSGNSGTVLNDPFDMGLCINCSTDNDVETWTATLGFMQRGNYILYRKSDGTLNTKNLLSGDTSMIVNISPQIITIPLTY